MTDFEQHLIRQMLFSRATFGPGERTNGIIDHIKKELVEVSDAESKPSEWVDVAILALDGLTRSIWVGMGYKITADEVASLAVRMILQKQGKNEQRDWPDHRKADPDKAIEHIEGKHD